MGFDIYYKLFSFDLYDCLMGLFIFIFIFIFGNRYANNKLSKTNAYYFKYGLLLKLISGISFALYHQYGYQGGDTFQYYCNAIAMNVECGFDIPLLISKLLKSNLTQDLEFYNKLNMVEDKFAISNSLYGVLRITSFIGIFTFNSFYANTLVYSFLSFLACWHFFLTLIKIYPNSKFALTRSLLFYPSVLFWGSSISKDTICIVLILLLFSSLLKVVILKRKIVLNLINIVICLYILSIIKAYIAISIVPCIVLWISLNYLNKISNNKIKQLVFPLVILIITVVGLLASNSLSILDNRFNNNQTLVEKAKNQQTNLQEAGSAYKLGFETTNPIVLALLGIVATLFRPFLWEVSNPFMLLAFLESTVIVLLFYLVMFKWGIKNFSSYLFKDNFIIFALVFTLIFAAGVGSSSGNFGTLVRYKTPCLPFLASALVIMFQQYNSELLYKNQSTLHKFFAKYLLGQKPPARFSKQFTNGIA